MNQPWVYMCLPILNTTPTSLLIPSFWILSALSLYVIKWVYSTKSKSSSCRTVAFSQEVVAQLYLTLCHPMTLAHQAPLSMRILQGRTLEWVTTSFSRDLPNPGIEPRSPALQTNSLPSEPPGKPKK